MTVTHARKINRPAPRKLQPADYIEIWAPLLRSIEPEAELDFSFSKDAITITDMRIPTAMRTGILFGRHDLDDLAHFKLGEVERRMHDYLSRG